MGKNKRIFMEDREAETYGEKIDKVMLDKQEEAILKNFKETEWKCKLADAILEEAEFNNASVKIGDKIEHQLGTIWIGNAVILLEKVIVFKCVHCRENIHSIEIRTMPSINNWRCPKCKKLNSTN